MSAHRVATAPCAGLHTFASVVILTALLAGPRVAAAQAGIPYAVDEADDETPLPAKAGKAKAKAKRPQRQRRGGAGAEDEAGLEPAAGQRDRAGVDKEAGPSQREGEGGGQDLEDAGAVAAAALGDSTPEPPRSGPDAFEQLWQRRRGAGQAEAEAALVELGALKQRSGWPNFFAYGEALARESAAARAADPAAALRLAEAAVALAPDWPGAHRALAAAAWSADGDLWRAARSLLRAYEGTWREPPLRVGRLGNMLIIVLLALAVAVALFTLAALTRHLRTLVHDLHHLLPRGATHLQTAILGMALLLVPVFLRLGIAWTVVAWIVILGMYYPWRERAGAMLVLAVLAGLPLALPWAVRGLAYPGSRAEAVYLAARDAGAAAAVARIEAQAAPSPEELFVLGLRAYWSSDLARAEDLLRRARAAGNNDPVLLTTLGNIDARRGDKQAAVADYQAAIEHDAEHVAAYFNLSRVYYSMAENQKAGEAHRRATAIDYERAEAYGEAAKRLGPDFMVDEEVSPRLLALEFSAGPEHVRAVEQVWGWVDGRGLTRELFSAVATAALLLVLLLGWLRRLVRPSCRCPRCGKPACKRCSPEMPDGRQCGPCYHLFMADERLDPQARVRKEIEVHRYQARRARVRRVLSLLLVGLPQLLDGAPLRGLPWLSAFFGLGLGIALATGVLPEPVAATSGAQWPSVAILAVLLLACYVAGVWDAQRDEDRGER